MIFVKKLLSVIIDIVLFASMLVILGINGLVGLYFVEHDISIVNTLLQTQLIPTMIAVYAVIMILYLIYMVVVARLLKGTPGQRIMKLTYDTEKLTIAGVFLKNIVGLFWDILLFPYDFFALIKKWRMPSIAISGITIVENKNKYNRTSFITLVIALFFVGVAGVLSYGVYKATPQHLIEQYTDYHKQTENLIKSFAFQDAANSLVKYKQFHGEDNEYIYFKCIIEGNIDVSTDILPTCDKSLTDQAQNAERVKHILLIEARIFAAEGSYTESEAKYAKLWNEYSVKTPDMKDYVVVLSELGKAKEASQVLTDIAAQVPESDLISMRDIGILYQRVNAPDLALEKFKFILTHISSGTNDSLAGEANYQIGVIMYNQGKKAESKPYFEAAKNLNKDYAESADSYIILINKLSGSITR